MPQEKTMAKKDREAQACREMLYHAELGSKIFLTDLDVEAALAAGWQDRPVDSPPDPEPAEIDPE
jgi:hypothetical protein